MEIEDYPYHIANINSRQQSPGFSGMDFADQIDWGEVFNKIDKYDEHLQALTEANEGTRKLQDVFTKVAAADQGDIDADSYRRQQFAESGAEGPPIPPVDPAMRIKNRAYRMLEALGAMDARNVPQKEVQTLMQKYADLLSKPDDELLKSQERRDNALMLQQLRGQQGIEKINTAADRRDAAPPRTLQGDLTRRVLNGELSIEEAYALSRKDYSGEMMMDKKGNLYSVTDGVVRNAAGEVVTSVPGGLRKVAQAEPAPKTPQLVEVDGKLVPWTPGTPVPEGAKRPGGTDTGRRDLKDEESRIRWARGQAAQDVRNNLKMQAAPEEEQRAYMEERAKFHLQSLPGYQGGMVGGSAQDSGGVSDGGAGFASAMATRMKRLGYKQGPDGKWRKGVK